MRSNACAARPRWLPAATLLYCSMAALQFPSTVSVFMAALNSRSRSCAAGTFTASMTASVTSANRFIALPPPMKLPAGFRDRSTGRSCFRHAFRVESVPYAAHALEELRNRRPRLDLPAEIRDLVVDDALGDRRVASPRFVDQDPAGQHATRPRHEQCQQLELERRHRHRLSGSTQLPA